MAGRSLALAAALAVLAALPALPAGDAQGSEAPAAPAPIVTVFSDGFEGAGTGGWRPSQGDDSPQGDEWRKVRDGTRTTWHASRVAENSTGYSNNVDVLLVSPVIVLPSDVVPRSVSAAVRGSSEEGADVLTMEWAPEATGPWQVLRSWTGDQETYQAEESTTNELLAYGNRTFLLRFRFVTDATCDSDPDPATDGVQETMDCDGAPCTPPDGPSPCTSYVGWFVDSVLVRGRRLFTEAAPADAPRVAVNATGANRTVDLLGDRGKVLEFQLDASNASVSMPSGASSVLVRLSRAGSQDVLTLSAQRVGSTPVWAGRLSVDEPDLVRGTWTVQFVAVSPSGGTVVATRTLTVQAQDSVAPAITVAAQGDPVVLGPGSGIGFTVADPLLRRVTFSHAGMPQPAELPFPYHVPETALPEGAGTLTIRAEDRAGHAATRAVRYDRDTTAPVLELDVPPVLYAGVAADLSAIVTERSGYTLRVDANGTLANATGAAGAATFGRATALTLTPAAPGNLTVTARANDTAGNEALLVRQFRAVPPVTDLRVESLRLATPATNIAREGQVLVATLRQEGGVAPLPVAVLFEAAGHRFAVNVTVPHDRSVEVAWNATLPPGRHQATVRAAGPETANETRPGNEDRALTIDVFLGRIAVGETVYVIRSDSRGLPDVAVKHGTTRTYRLEVVDEGKGVAYRFTTEANRTLVWDPLEPVMVVGNSTTTPTDDGRDAPFPGLVMAAGVLALAALAQRRRR